MKTLKSFEFKPLGTRKSSYDWDTLLDGSIHQLEEEADYQCSSKTMHHMAYGQGRKRGLRVRFSTVEGGVVLQAVPASQEGNGEAPAPKAPAPKAKAK